jgi:hypothetical protein
MSRFLFILRTLAEAAAVIGGLGAIVALLVVLTAAA